MKEVGTVTGYTAVVDDSNKGNIIITNSRNTNIIATTNTPTNSTKTFLSNLLPETGAVYNYMFSLIGLLVLLTLNMFYDYKKQKN